MEFVEGTTLRCKNCLHMGRAAFQKAFELNKTGLQIYKYRCWENDKAECLGRGVSPKKDYIILDNTTEKELRRPDFIKELCQYKTKCENCKIILRRVLQLLEAVDEIKKREVVGVCEHCKRRKKLACKRCDYLIEKYLEQRKALEKEILLKNWLEELQHILEPLPDKEIKIGRDSKTLPWHGKQSPKEFRYPPARELFPDHGTPFVTKYPQSRELSLIKKGSPELDDSYLERKRMQAMDSQGRQSPAMKSKVTAEDLNYKVYSKNRLSSIDSKLHAPLMRGPSEFPYVTGNYESQKEKLLSSTKHLAHRYSASTKPTQAGTSPDFVMKRNVDVTHDVVEQPSPRAGRRLYVREANMYEWNVSPTRKLSQFVGQKKGSLRDKISPSRKHGNLATDKEPLASDATSPKTHKSVISGKALSSKAHQISQPGEQRNAYDLISATLNKRTAPGNMLSAIDKRHKHAITTKTEPLLRETSRRDKSRSKKNKNKDEFNEPSDKRNFVSKDDQRFVKEFPSPKKRRDFHGEITKNHEQSSKPGPVKKGLKTTEPKLFEKKAHGISKKTHKADIRQTKNYSEFTGLLQGDRKPKTHSEQKEKGKSMPGSNKKANISNSLEDFAGKDTKSSLDQKESESKEFTLKSIIQKNRHREIERNKNVSMKLDKDEFLKKQHKNLHKLDIKIEKIIYDKFVAHMEKIQKEKEKRKAELREKRKLNMSKSRQSKVDVRKRKQLQSRHVAKLEVSNTKTWHVDLDSDFEDEEEDMVTTSKSSIEQPVSDSDSNPVECSVEEIPNVKILGNKIVKIKDNESCVLSIYETSDLQSPKVKYNPPVMFWENPITECDTPVLDGRIMQYELSNRIWIENGWTLLPKQVVVKEICLYDMVPLPDTWFLMHKHQTLFYRSGEKLAVIDEEGNGKVFYKNGELAIQHNINKELSLERVVVYSSGEGLHQLSPRRRIRKLAVFDHLGSGVVFDGNGRTRLKYNQSEGQKIDSAIKGNHQWQFHSLNKKSIVKTIYEETIEPLGSNESITGAKPKKKEASENPLAMESMLAIEQENRVKNLKKTEYDLITCNIGPFHLSKHFKMQIKNQRDIVLHFLDAAGVRVNLGMKMISTSLIGYILSKEREVVTTLDKHIDIQYY